MGMLAILDHTGDTQKQWDVNDAASVAEAGKVFDEFREKNYLAYKKVGEGSGEQIRAFDPTAEEIVMARPLVGG